MKTVKNKILFASLLIGSFLSAEVLYLGDLIKEAIINSPDIKISKANYDASVQNSIQADSGYLPRLDLSVRAGKEELDYGNQKVGTSGATLIQPGKIQTNLLAAQISAKQLIYDFGKTIGSMQSFQNRSYAFKAAMHQSISDKIYAVKKAYYELLFKHAIVDVNKENIKLNEQQLYRSKRYFQAGIRTKVDVIDSQVNLIKAQLDLQNTYYDIKISLIKLKKEVGINNEKEADNKDIFIQKPESVNIYDSLPKLKLPVSTYKEKAYKNRAELEQYIQLLKSSMSVYKQRQGDYYPSVYANAEYLLQDVDEDAFAPEKQWKTTVSLE